jgi:isoleucyl-tRNA synthetase
MADVMSAVELGRRLRADNDLKVRQPLSALRISGGDVKGLEELIEDELNVKSVVFIADETELCNVSFKANFKTLGKKCGPKMKAVAAAIAAAKAIPAEIEGVAIAEEDVLVTRTPKEGLVVASEGAVVVGLETSLTPELVAEGLAREFVSHVQAMRKEADFEVTQRIAVAVKSDAEVRAALEAHLKYVKNEILAVDIAWSDDDGGVEVDLNGHSCRVAVNPVVAG